MTNDKSRSFDAIEWARSYAPTVLKADGKPDGVAMHVLLTLATYADGSTGKNARPSQDTLATDTRLAVTTVARKLVELEKAGLIVTTGVHGPTGWQVKVYALNLDEKREDDGSSAVEAARKQAARKQAARQKRYRDALRDRHASTTVTHSETVTPNVEHVDSPQRDAPEDRHVTVPEPSRDALPVRSVTHSDGEYLSVDLSLTSQEDLSVSDGRSTGRAASVSKLTGGAATADADPGEGQEPHWAEELADEDASPAVVVEAKDGEDEELAAGPVSEAASDPVMDQIMADVRAAERERPAQSAPSLVPAAPQALSLDERTKLAVKKLPRRLSWWTPNQVRSYLASAASDSRAMARCRDAGIADLVGE